MLKVFAKIQEQGAKHLLAMGATIGLRGILNSPMLLTGMPIVRTAIVEAGRIVLEI
jgi:hypothetical protein